MKKILYFTITYTSIALFMISLLGPNNNFWLWLAIGITLLTLPIIVSKLLKDNYNISKELIIAICSLLCLSISALVLNSKEPKYDLIAITSDLQKASDIQKLLGLENPSISQYIFDEKGEPSEIGIFIPRTSKENFYNTIKFLLNSSIIDNNVFIGSNAKQSNSPKQMINNMEKEIEHFIYSFRGISKVKVNINNDGKEIKNIEIKVRMNENINTQKTERLIKQYVEHSLQNVKPEQIKLYVNMF